MKTYHRVGCLLLLAGGLLAGCDVSGPATVPPTATITTSYPAPTPMQPASYPPSTQVQSDTTTTESYPTPQQ